MDLQAEIQVSSLANYAALRNPHGQFLRAEKPLDQQFPK
jgi:hypothetical protein